MIDLRFRGFKQARAQVRDVRIYFKEEYTPEILKYGYNYAKRVMPRDKGNLSRALELKAFKKRGSIIQHMPAQNRRNPRPYHMWLNGTGNKSYLRSDGSSGNININRFMANIRTGKPMYMARTRSAMIKKASDLAKAKAQKTNTRYK